MLSSVDILLSPWNRPYNAQYTVHSHEHICIITGSRPSWRGGASSIQSNPILSSIFPPHLSRHLSRTYLASKRRGELYDSLSIPLSTRLGSIQYSRYEGSTAE